MQLTALQSQVYIFCTLHNVQVQLLNVKKITCAVLDMIRRVRNVGLSLKEKADLGTRWHD